MAIVTIPNRPAGTDVRSIAAILANFDAITTDYNGNIDATNIKDGSITSAKFAAGAVSSLPIGSMVDYAIDLDPTDPNWLLCDGRALSRTTYATLFAALVPSKGTVTITLASPGVFTTGSAHKLSIGDPVYLTTTGNLPTGLTANTLYYVLTVPTSTTFTVSATLGGAAVNTSVGQNGVHTLYLCNYGLGDASTTFNIPDYRGRVSVGPDDMKTAAGAASRLPNQSSKVRGGAAGTDTHTLTSAQVPSFGTHRHQVYRSDTGAGIGQLNMSTGTYYTNFSTVDPPGGYTDAQSIGGSGGSHPNMQPYLIGNKIIKVA